MEGNAFEMGTFWRPLQVCYVRLRYEYRSEDQLRPTTARLSCPLPDHEQGWQEIFLTGLPSLGSISTTPT